MGAVALVIAAGPLFGLSLLENANAARSTIGRQPHFGYHLVIRIVGNYLDQHNRKICPLLFVTFLSVMVDGEHAEL